MALLAPPHHVHHYHAHNPGCRTRACDWRVWRRWAREHRARQGIGEPLRESAGSATTAGWYEDQGATACGSHYQLGVANKTLACGTRVRICYQGCVIATVDDRGPYVEGRELDLNAAAKAAISCTDLCPVRWSVLR